jgi:extracellular factor (EF) 3-hydroxypalmitic acid methyl ester biosynthesis protein
MQETAPTEALVTARTVRGSEIHGTPVRLSQDAIVFETYSGGAVVQSSEILTEFTVVLRDWTLHLGRAVVRSVMDTGPALLCEVAIEDTWHDLAKIPGPGELGEGFQHFYQDWQKRYRVLPEYKILAADIQTFLTDLRLWVEQLELRIRSCPTRDRLTLERQTSEQLSRSALGPLDWFFEKYEHIASTIPPELQPIHRTYIKRQVQPLVLSSPFAFRTVTKPLGYAGDYEVVNMILRDPHEGASLFGKLLNRWFIKQPPAQAHRNRIGYLSETLAKETVRVAARGEPCRVLSLGCGPAKEVQDFIAQSELSNKARFTLVDFNDETLSHARAMLQNASRTYDRNPAIEIVRKSVAQLLKGKDKKTQGLQGVTYDFVYCAGLFDYLTDAVCRQLTRILYDMVSPGGLLVVTNVDASNPIRNWLGDILEWHLIYRNERQMRALRPEMSEPDMASIRADDTGVNLFLEIRKGAS